MVPEERIAFTEVERNLAGLMAWHRAHTAQGPSYLRDNDVLQIIDEESEVNDLIDGLIDQSAISKRTMTSSWCG